MSRTFDDEKRAAAFVKEIRLWREQTGGVCVAANIIVEPAEWESADFDNILATKVKRAAEAMELSARTLVEQRKAAA